MVCDKLPFHCTPTRLAQWHQDFVTNGDKFTECKQGKWEREWLLDQTDLKLRAVDFLNGYDDWKSTKDDEYLTVTEFQQWLNDVLLPPLTVEELKGVTWPICKDTARVWMHRLGFGYDTYKKDIYFDGHDRPDVVAYKVEHLSHMEEYQNNFFFFVRC